MPAAPDDQPLFCVSFEPLPVLAEIERNRSAVVDLPELSSSSRPITCTGLKPSVLARRMLDPVTTTSATE